ncbi:MAG: YgfZ/GcvT domain-containing protein [Actinomycetota bacterium]
MVVSGPGDGGAALRDGRAALVHTTLRAVRIDGADARGWLHDLVTADIASLAPGELRPSLLLTPTGRIRAAFSVAAEAAGFVLLQEDDQDDVGAMLAPYVLSASVAIATDARSFVSIPTSAVTDGRAGATWRPSLLPTHASIGALVAVAPPDLDALRARLASAGIAEACRDDAERLRVEEGVARFPVDLDDALPAEAGWEDRIDLAKGCFLGQESVAKVRNLGHPPRVVRAFATAAPVAAGDTVVLLGDPVGEITSAVDAPDGGRCICRVRWDARAADLATASGVRLRPR